MALLVLRQTMRCALCRESDRCCNLNNKDALCIILCQAELVQYQLQAVLAREREYWLALQRDVQRREALRSRIH